MIGAPAIWSFWTTNAIPSLPPVVDGECMWNTNVVSKPLTTFTGSAYQAAPRLSPPLLGATLSCSRRMAPVCSVSPTGEIPVQSLKSG